MPEPSSALQCPMKVEGVAAIVTFTVAMLESTVPSFALKVNESAPVAPALGVYV